jgi:hypothetical protein
MRIAKTCVALTLLVGIAAAAPIAKTQPSDMDLAKREPGKVSKAMDTILSFDRTEKKMKKKGQDIAFGDI